MLHKTSAFRAAAYFFALMVIGCGTPSSISSSSSALSVIFSFPVVQISASPDFKKIWPEVLIQENTTVKLTGIAKKVSIMDDFSSTSVALSYTWSLSFQPIGGVPIDVSSELQFPGSLSPKFFAKKGIYRVKLESHGSDPKDNQSTTLKIEAVSSNGAWFSIGPDGRWPISTGRVNAIAFATGKSDIVYAGTSHGGVWRANGIDGEWMPMTDHKGFPANLSISRLAVAPGGRVYAGTGDFEGSYFPGTSNGLYASDDGGITWQNLSSGAGCAVASATPTGAITRILIDPSDPKLIFAAAGNGVFRSDDAGACWTNILPGRSTYDLALLLESGRTTLYAAVMGATTISASVLKTDDAKLLVPAWHQTQIVQQKIGTKAGNISRISLATSKHVIYAIANRNNLIEVYRATNSIGWIEKNQPLDAVGNNRCDDQCLYNFAIAANPSSPDDVIIGTVTAFRSTDGGIKWSEFNPGSSIYSDQHALVFHPTIPNLLFTGNDGGIEYINVSPVGSWRWWNYGFNTILSQGSATSYASGWSDGAVIGLQDNGSRMRQYGRVWTNIGGGDGRTVALDVSIPKLAYFHVQWATGITLKRSTDGKVVGNATNFWSDPFTAGTLLGTGLSNVTETGMQLYKTEKLDIAPQATWSCIDPTPADLTDAVTTVAFPSKGNYLAGTSRGAIYKLQVADNSPIVFPCGTKAAGTSSLLWQPGVAQAYTPQRGIDDSRVISIAVDPADPDNHFYATLARYDQWRVVNFLKNVTGTWDATPIAQNFPLLPSCAVCNNPSGGAFVAPIIVDPFNSAVYVGTDKGLFSGSSDANGNWTWLQDQDIPETWVTGLTLGGSGFNRPVRAYTYGRAVYERINFVHFANIPPIERKFPNWPILHPADYRVFRVIPIDDNVIANTKNKMLRVIPTIGGRQVPYFHSEQLIQSGDTGTLLMPIYYSNREAPLKFKTDGLRIELLGKDGKVIDTIGYSQEMHWMRYDAASVQINSNLIFEEGGSLPIEVPIKTNLKEKNSRTNSSETLVVKRKTYLTLEVPKTIKTSAGIAHFAGWLPRREDDKPSTQISIQVEDDLQLTANYWLEKNKKAEQKKEYRH
jgi:hypothetical protein